MNALSAAAWVAAFFLCASLFSHTVALRLLLLILGVALCAWALMRDRKSVRALPPIWLAFALWGAWAGLSILWSVEPGRSAKEFQNEILYTAAALWFCFVAAQAVGARRIIVPVFAGGVVLVCATAIYFSSPATGTYSGGWQGGPGDLSSALLTITPFFLALSLRSGNRWVHFGTAILGAMVVASAYTTFNRTIWVGFASELAIFAAFVLGSHWRSLSKRGRVIAIGGAATLVAGVAGTASVVHFEREAMHSAFPIKQDPRLSLWPKVVDLVEQRPIAGYGFGRGLMRRQLAQDSGDGMLWHSHNIFLDSALQTGLPGLVTFCLLLFMIVRSGLKGTASSDPYARAAGVALIAVVAGMLVRNMTDLQWIRQNSLLFWGIVGVLLAWILAPHPREETAAALASLVK